MSWTKSSPNSASASEGRPGGRGAAAVGGGCRQGETVRFDAAYDVIVVGGGHAGCEAALAAARLGGRALLLTMSLETIALMPCNPAIGGLAKGHLVREIDALGGEMGRCIDETGIQFRMLNTGKGPAVRAPRAQADKRRYRLAMRRRLEEQPGLDLVTGRAEQVLFQAGRIAGVVTETGGRLRCAALVLATGTFLNGLCHVGLTNYAAGRAGECAALRLSDALQQLGFEIGRLKTGTPPRLHAASIDFAACAEQPGDEPPLPFSYSTTKIEQPQLSCWLTHTNPATHAVIRANLGASPLYAGVIKGIGPRYCPSLEDKVMRFPERRQHQVFLEPEGYETPEIYCNGISTSLPAEVQRQVVHSIAGLERAKMLRAGYAVEYDFVMPTQLLPSLMTKRVPGLFHAGQINGTSGYEEAAAQGLMAGINAARYASGKEPVVLRRDQAYIGVLIDDLVTKGTREPYRMFTSRAEYRLLLRQDNADLRLRDIGHEVGLVDEATHRTFRAKRRLIEAEITRLEATAVHPTAENNAILARFGSASLGTARSLATLLARPELDYWKVNELLVAGDKPARRLTAEVVEQVEIALKYKGYIARQEDEVARFLKLEERPLPADLEYPELTMLSKEVREKLAAIRPQTIGQASRIAGVTPAAISILGVLTARRDGPARRTGEA
ncbi:MAG: tRNA uridine-5-carboxymethylaminomethyl(34) synthesis enzyme MnmG [Candidatus Tectomicrobia bacterium]|nr:tRNA uridine-5-carboxymethylaminomethyl(34) synthesis enzyme MnmG [Candidatus Tectomicrobia bacterium]